jgi:fructoselysine-6-P-deglycase FrlB-like protein
MSSSIPLRPIEPDLAEVLSRALSKRDLTREIAAAAADREIDEIYFVGMGGSWASSVPVVHQLQTSALRTPVWNINAAEFSAAYLDRLSPSTLVVAASHSGGTPETVLAAQQSAARGALVVGVATDDQNPLSEASSFQLTYGSDRTITSSKYVLLSELALSLIEKQSSADSVARTRAALDLVPSATVAATEAAEDQLAQLAKDYAGADNIFVLASGPLSGLAYLLSVCYFVEMQWKKSTHFTTGDFFHGPFELATADQPYILFSGADSTRAHADRARTFLDRYNPNYRVVDAATLELPGIPTDQLAAIQHIPLASITMRIADHFEAASGHDLDERRYMHRVEY